MSDALMSTIARLKKEYPGVMVRVIETATVRAGSDQIEWEYRIVVPKYGILEMSEDLSDVLQKVLERRR